MAEKGSQETHVFSSPEEELQFLREEVSRKEHELEETREAVDKDEIIWEEVGAYRARKPEEVLAPEYRLEEKQVEGIALDLVPEEHDEQMNELLGVLSEKGIRNTLSVIEKMNNPHVEDDFHRLLIQYVKKGFPVAGLKEKGPLWSVLHMTLYEIALPEARKEEIQQKTLKELLSSMEQFYAGMLSISDAKNVPKQHFTFEIAVADKSDEIILYAAIPDHKKDLFEKQILSSVSSK